MLFLTIPLIFVLGTVVFSIKRGVFFSRTSQNLDQMIPEVTSIDEFIAQFKALLRTDFRCDESKRSWREKRVDNRKTLRRILAFLGQFGKNANLFGDLARHEIRAAHKPGVEGYYELSVQRLLKGAAGCKALVIIARLQIRFWLIVNYAAWFMPPRRVSPLLQRSCRRLLDQYDEIRVLALGVASHHGEYYYDNLLSAL